MNPYHEYIEFRKVRDFSETINDSFTFLKLQFRALFKPLLYICGFFVLATMATQVLQQLKTVKLLGLAKASSAGNGFMPTDISSYTFGVEYFLVLLFTMLSISAIYLVTYCYIKLYKDQSNTSPHLEEVWTLFKQHIVRFFVTSLLLTVLMVIGFVFCLIPGFYLMPIVSLALPAMVMEDKGIADSFSRSIHLIKEHWWKTFGILLVASLITYFSMSILGLPSALLGFGAVFLQSSPTLVLIGSIFSSMLTAAANLFYVFPAVVSTLCYFSLSEEKDGSGLFERIEQFGGDTKSTDNDWPKEEY